MGDLRYAGMGWPVGAVKNATILALPSRVLLMCATEARYHADEAVSAGKRVLWRAIPRHGFKPAELKYNARRFADEAMNLTDEASLPIAEMIAWNELDLNSERGDNADDWSDLDARYSTLGQFQLGVISELRKRLPGTVLHYGAWTPDHDAIGYIRHWTAAANAADIIDFHAYDTLEKIRGQYAIYRAAFPEKRLFLAEWHGKGDLGEEQRILQWLADTAAADPLFDGAAFFIWDWPDAPGWWSTDFDIAHNPNRFALFRDPPVAVTQPEPEPVPEPPVEEPPPMPPPADLPRGLDVASYQGYPDWAAVAAAGYSFAFTKVTEDTGYLNPTFAHNWGGIKAAGMARGAYHFARPAANDASNEADYCLSQIEAQGGLEEGDIIALDLEAGSGDLGQWVLDFLHRCEEIAGIRPIVYTGAWFSEPHNLASYPEIGQYGLWLAAYQSHMPAPPAPWGTIAFWQHTDALSVPGISGNVDGNVFNGTAERIKLYGKPAAEPEPEQPPSPYSVGPGILEALAAHGDEPATDEIGAPNGQYSEAWGTSGAHYVYLKVTNRTYRYDPAA